jgi:hypothetical protein
MSSRGGSDDDPDFVSLFGPESEPDTPEYGSVAADEAEWEAPVRRRVEEDRGAPVVRARLSLEERYRGPCWCDDCWGL